MYRKLCLFFGGETKKHIYECIATDDKEKKQNDMFMQIIMDKEWNEAKAKAEGLLFLMDPSSPDVVKYFALCKIYDDTVDAFYIFVDKIEPNLTELQYEEAKKVRSGFIQNFQNVYVDLRKLFEKIN